MSSGVEFDEDAFAPTRSAARMNAASSSTSGLSGWLMRKGYAKSESAAKWIQIAIIVANVIITIIVIRWAI